MIISNSSVLYYVRIVFLPIDEVKLWKFGNFVSEMKQFIILFVLNSMSYFVGKPPIRYSSQLSLDFITLSNFIT